MDSITWPASCIAGQEKGFKEEATGRCLCLAPGVYQPGRQRAKLELEHRRQRGMMALASWPREQAGIKPSTDAGMSRATKRRRAGFASPMMETGIGQELRWPEKITS